jgi:hypothetical protein
MANKGEPFKLLSNQYGRTDYKLSRKLRIRFIYPGANEAYGGLKAKTIKTQ